MFKIVKLNIMSYTSKSKYSLTENHLKINKNINTLKLLNCIDNNKWLNIRSKLNHIHKNTSNIIIIKNKKIKVNKKKYLPILQFLEDFANKYKGEICGANIVFLPKNKYILPHIDGIRYNIKYSDNYDYLDRYHLVLFGDYLLNCGNDIKHYKKGDLWWFNNKKIHSVKALSDRIALIFDVKH